MAQIIFKSREEAYDWISDNLIQEDVRYIALAEDQIILAQFFYGNACVIEENEIMKLEQPSHEELYQIGGPQEYHKFIALQLLLSKDIERNKIFFERSFVGRKVDVLAEDKDKVTLVECCSCSIQKVIEYLEEENTEMGIITAGYGPWDTMFPKKDHSRWFVIKRGQNWEESHKKFIEYKDRILDQVKDKISNLEIV